MEIIWFYPVHRAQSWFRRHFRFRDIWFIFEAYCFLSTKICQTNLPGPSGLTRFTRINQDICLTRLKTFSSVVFKVDVYHDDLSFSCQNGLFVKTDLYSYISRIQNRHNPIFKSRKGAKMVLKSDLVHLTCAQISCRVKFSWCRAH